MKLKWYSRERNYEKSYYNNKSLSAYGRLSGEECNEALEEEVVEMMGSESVEKFIDRAVEEAMKQILDGTEKEDTLNESRKRKIHEIARQEHRNNN